MFYTGAPIGQTDQELKVSKNISSKLYLKSFQCSFLIPVYWYISLYSIFYHYGPFEFCYGTFDEHFLFSSTTRFHSDLLRLTFFHSLQTWATTRSESTSRKRNIFCSACLRFLVSSRRLVGALISISSKTYCEITSKDRIMNFQCCKLESF